LTTDYAQTDELQNNIREMVTDWLAVGWIREAPFVQSRLPEHAELHVLFSMVTLWAGWSASLQGAARGIMIASLPHGFLGHPLLQSQIS
jgi:tryptophanyl-tRNA synthetase